MKTRRTKIGLAIVLFDTLLVVVYAFVSWQLSSLVIYPSLDREDREFIERVDAGLEHYEGETLSSFALKAKDGIDIYGWYLSANVTPHCVVVFSHGWGASRHDPKKYQALFSDYQCDVVLYDQRAHGLSSVPFGSGGLSEKHDLITITEWLKSGHGWEGEQIAWFGLSWGANTSLQAAAMYHDVAFVVADSAFKDWDSAIFERGVRRYGAWIKVFKWGMDWSLYLRTGARFSTTNTLEQVASIQVPVMLIHSRTDEATDSTQSQALSRALKSERSVFHHTDWGAGHVGHFDTHAERYATLLNDFIVKFAPSFTSKTTVRENTERPDE